jgi:hypothetical protein
MTPTAGLKGETDADTLAGAATPRCSDGIDNDADGFIDAADAGCSVPEYKALDYTIVAAASPPAGAPRTCGNWSYYDSTSLNADGGVAPEVDEDGDTTVNAADPNCAAIADDTDQDGVLDGVLPARIDNCTSVWNPTQLDTDGGCTTGSTTDTAGACGDACDVDDDGDGINDTVEWAAGNDAKNVCDPRNFDHVPNGLINIADVTTYIAALKVTDRPCSPPLNYNVCR